MLLSLTSPSLVHQVWFSRVSACLECALRATGVRGRTRPGDHAQCHHSRFAHSCRVLLVFPLAASASRPPSSPLPSFFPILATSSAVLGPVASVLRFVLLSRSLFSRHSHFSLFSLRVSSGSIACVGLTFLKAFYTEFHQDLGRIGFAPVNLSTCKFVSLVWDLLLYSLHLPLPLPLPRFELPSIGARARSGLCFVALESARACMGCVISLFVLQCFPIHRAHSSNSDLVEVLVVAIDRKSVV